jgi:hypothetical protein
MKKAMLLAAFIVACGPADESATDTAAMASPAALTAADLTGTWSGTTMMEGSDSVIGRWTVTSATGTEGRVVFEGATDTVMFTHSFDADSFVGMSAPYADPTTPGTPQVTTRAVGRLIAGRLVGTATTMLASNPDSVVSRTRWEATKQ